MIKRRSLEEMAAETWIYWDLWMCCWDSAHVGRCWELFHGYIWLVTMVFFPCVFPSHVSEERVVIKRMGNFALVKVLWSFVEFRSAVPCFSRKKSAEFYRILQKLDSGGGQAARSPWAGPRDRKISKAGVGQCMAMSFAKLTFSRLLCDFRLYNRTYRSCFDSTRAFEYAACHESADGEAI